MPTPYSIPLQPGWNLIAFPGHIEQPALKDVFSANVYTSIVLAYRDSDWVTAIWDDEWRGDLKQCEVGFGYWVHTRIHESIQARLTTLANCRPSLIDDWNLIGCTDRTFAPAGGTTSDLFTLDEYLEGLDWRVAYRFDGVAFRRITPRAGTPMRLAAGYWVFAGEDDPGAPPDMDWFLDSDTASRMGR